MIAMGRLRAFLNNEWRDNGWFSRVLPVLSFLTACLCVVVFDKSKDLNHTVITLVMLGAVAAAVFVRRLSGHRFTTRDILLCLFVVGFILRLDYVLYTTIDMTSVERQHDLGGLGITTTTGHEAYINWFYYNGLKIWDPTIGQFYQPPLHYMLTALWMRLITFLGMSYERAVVSIQYLTMFYSTCCMIVTERMLNALDIRGGGAITAFAVVVFHPSFLILGGSANNDMLSVLFILLALYAAIRWYQDPTLKRILLIALAIGLGMMTKLTAVLAAPAIAFLFLAKLIQRKGQRLRQMGQYVAFACVSFPLGLWYPLWKYVKYDVSLDYVPRQSNEYLQYIGDYEVWQRFFDFSNHPFRSVYETWEENAEYNIFAAAVKTAVFGETSFADGPGLMMFLSRLLLWVNIFLTLLSVFALFYCTLKKDPGDRIFDGPLRAYILIFEGFSIAYYVYYCFDYPHTCSMDYRYITSTCVPLALMLGMMTNRLRDGKNQTGKALYVLTPALVGAFCGLSAWVYLLLGIID